MIKSLIFHQILLRWFSQEIN